MQSICKVLVRTAKSKCMLLYSLEEESDAGKAAVPAVPAVQLPFPEHNSFCF